MIVTEETKANAQAVLDYILTNPDKHEQNNWLGKNGKYFWRHYEGPVTDENICGTTMCAAGTAIYLFEGVEGLNDIGRSMNGDTWSNKAAPYFGFENHTEWDKLFYTMDNDCAVDMITALAQGDVDKFNYLAELDRIE